HPLGYVVALVVVAVSIVRLGYVFSSYGFLSSADVQANKRLASYEMAPPPLSSIIFRRFHFLACSGSLS
ncbi:MAG: hypothetical protein V2A73_04850, partial [Pseudomonadota bacterium]